MFPDLGTAVRLKIQAEPYRGIGMRSQRVEMLSRRDARRRDGA